MASDSQDFKTTHLAGKSDAKTGGDVSTTEASSSAKETSADAVDMFIPEQLTFEQAIAFTHKLLSSIEQQAIGPDAIERMVAQLVSTMNGARGFFVTYLTDERTLFDQPSTPVVQALSQKPEIVAELLVKNLAMSSAMVVAHRRRQDEGNAQGSEKVRSRTITLLNCLPQALVQGQMNALAHALKEQEGAYQAFLVRWGYDAEQLQAIRTAVSETNVLNTTETKEI